MTTGAELLVECLEAAGIDTVYGVPGEETSDLMQALDACDGIDFVLTRHEQGAAFMASVHGRITGTPAACLATLGPGATNLVTGVADAQLDYVPMLVLTAQGARSRMNTRQSHQIIDLQALFAPVTKQSRTILTTDSIPGAVAEAVRLACLERPGAVHLSLPEDVAKEPAKGAPVKAVPPVPQHPDPNQIDCAVAALRRAERPVILAGRKATGERAARALRDLAETANIPVTTSFFGKGVVPPDHPLWLPAVGQPFADTIDALLDSCDLLVAVGFDPIEYAPGNNGADVGVLHLAETTAALDVGWRIVADVPGALDITLTELARRLSHRWSDWPEAGAVRQAALEPTAREDRDGRLNPDAVLDVVQDTFTPDDLILSGVGTHKMKVADRIRPARPGQLIIANGLAGMGLALPGAISAARLGRHDGLTLAVAGDGEFFMNLQEMETARRLGRPFAVLLFEDGGLGLIEAKEDQDLGSHSDHSFGTPDWDHLTAAFGWIHTRADSYGAVADALQAAREDVEKPRLITIPIHYDAPLKDRV